MDDLTGAVMVSVKDILMEMMIMLVEELLYKCQNHAIFVLFYLDSFVQGYRRLVSKNIV